MPCHAGHAARTTLQPTTTTSLPPAAEHTPMSAHRRLHRSDRPRRRTFRCRKRLCCCPSAAVHRICSAARRTQTRAGAVRCAAEGRRGRRRVRRFGLRRRLLVGRALPHTCRVPARLRGASRRIRPSPSADRPRCPDEPAPPPAGLCGANHCRCAACAVLHAPCPRRAAPCGPCAACEGVAGLWCGASGSSSRKPRTGARQLPQNKARACPTVLCLSQLG